MDIIPLPAFQDNYIWIIRHGETAIVVDPADAAIVREYLDQQKLRLSTILITHHHDDHIGGIAGLLADGVSVYGPAQAQIPGITHPVAEGDRIIPAGYPCAFDVFATPGHTQTHLAYYSKGILFPGDTLFSAGCGRLLGGTAAELEQSLRRLAALPDETKVYSSHEYTLSNLAFAAQAEPGNQTQLEWAGHCRQLRAEAKPTLPSTIAREKAINPFLRTEQAAVIDALTRHNGTRPTNTAACFAALRAWKDHF